MSEIYTLTMNDEGGSTDTETFEAADDDAAREAVEDIIEAWVSGGSWGEAGAEVPVSYTLSRTEIIEEDSYTISVPPDHAALISAAVPDGADYCGDDPDDHTWVATEDIEGGCSENPGVWGGDGTTLVFRSHCERCGLGRREVHRGSQRNPGEADTVEYFAPPPPEVDEDYAILVEEERRAKIVADRDPDFEARLHAARVVEEAEEAAWAQQRTRDPRRRD